MTPLDLPQPYLVFLGDVTEVAYTKTAAGLRDWAPDQCIGEYGLPKGDFTLGLPVLRPAEAYEKGARAVVIGVAPMGGGLNNGWIPPLVEALEAGLDIISGMHASLSSVPELKDAAERLGRRLIDVRRPPSGLPVATGRKRTGKRLLTVGTDCALGKKYTALAIADAFQARGVNADFRATGQTGVIIAGGGIPMDSVVADFLAGAAEVLSPDAAPDHWDIVEGQGSLFHPAYAGVSLGLLHGSQPDVLVVCHKIGRDHVLGIGEAYPLPSVEETIEVNLYHARRVNRGARCAGISLNTASLDDEAAAKAIAEYSERTGLPCADPIRGGAEFARLVDSCLNP